MCFPKEWTSLDMYPDELAEIQLAGYIEGHENAPEHDRNGAFHWWLRRDPSVDYLRNLMYLASIDPDKHLGNDVKSYIEKSKYYDISVELVWYNGL